MSFLKQNASVPRVMGQVLLAMLPALLFYMYCYGLPAVWHVVAAMVAAVGSETILLLLRRQPVLRFLGDGSALITAWLIAVAVPPHASIALTIAAVIFALVFGKHVYGGLGYNIFNPAMVGIAMLLVSFPAQMNEWVDSLQQATPLARFKGGSMAMLSMWGFEFIWAALWTLGGLFLWWRRLIYGLSSCVMLLTMFLLLLYFQPEKAGSLLFSGAACMGAWFVLTDPVSGPATYQGKLYFAVLVGALTVLIRLRGAFPEGFAFAILLGNLCVPLLDAYTRPKVFGR